MDMNLLSDLGQKFKNLINRTTFIPNVSPIVTKTFLLQTYNQNLLLFLAAPTSGCFQQLPLPWLALLIRADQENALTVTLFG
jgi:hypothetical protein